MITLEEIQEEAKTDLILDDTQLDKESIKIPQLHNKYLIYLNSYKSLYRKQIQSFNKLKLIKQEYYTGKLSEEVLKEMGWEPFQLKILKNDIDLYLEADKDLQVADLKIEQTKIILDYLEGILKNIMNRHWMIRSCIEWKKFINGVV